MEEEGLFRVVAQRVCGEFQHRVRVWILGRMLFFLGHKEVLVFLLELGLYKQGILGNENGGEAIYRDMASKIDDHRG
jgi:hypothetical protein